MGGASKLLMLVSAPLPLLYPRASAFRLARYSSVSVAWLSSVAHRRRFFSNPRPFPCFSIKASEQIHTQTSNVREDYYGESSEFLSSHLVSHPWPEWSKLLENLKAGGFFDRQGSSPMALDGELSMDENLPKDFLSVANACLSFAGSRSDILGSLSIKDIEVVIENGTPFLFKDALDSARRMKSFVRDRGNNGLEIERADMVDLMRYLLSYACNAFVASDRVNISNKEMVESSVRNLLSELADATITDQGLCLSGSMSNHYTDSYGQTPRPVGPNIEMKRGDWICQKCSFMNFARNMKCLECNESRPKRQLAGGEWECPQCDFFNYGRNSTCLRCDCKRPGGPTYGAMTPRSDLGYSNESNLNKADIESRLGENDEKAERWFSKFSRLDKASDLDGAAADKDFPEIMPLRKGVNRFVVSTRKTPLERRLADAQYRRNLGNDGTPDEDDFQARNEGEVNQSMTLQTSISQSLDRILGCSSAHSETGANGSVVGEMAGTEKSSFSSSASQHYGRSEAQKLEMVSGVAGNLDSFAPSTSNTIGSFSESVESGKSKDGLHLSGIPLNQAESKEDREQAEKSERWFKKVAELHDVKDLSSAISDEDFPEIMPMRKGENRFVVSKKKDRSMTSPLYKRRMAMEQSSNTNFVPFVPFPPDYFAKKDKQSGTESSTKKALNENASVGTAESAPNVLGKSSAAGVVTNWGASSTSVPRLENQHASGESWDTTRAVNGCGKNNCDAVYRVPTMAMSGERPENLQNRNGEGWNTGSSQMGSAESAGYGASTVGSPISRTEWNSGLSQKGSAESAGYCASTTPRTDWNSRSSQRGSAECAGYGTSAVGGFTSGTDWNNGSSQRGSAESAGYGTTVGGFIPRTDWNSGSNQRGSAESAGYGASTARGITPRTDWNSGSSQTVSAGYGASAVGGFTSRTDNLQMNSGEVWNSGSSWKGSMGSPTMGSTTPGSDNLKTNSRESWDTGSSWKGSTGGAMGSSSQQPQNDKNGPESWNRGFSGGSLEGSAVKEPDPLDMSQEAKEQRWFRRVAQIKDISELSNIPDEDFPEIMPMRKGVNRFVVSKRKTPLERRLTSPQYRRNLPIVNSDPLKKENDSS